MKRANPTLAAALMLVLCACNRDTSNPNEVRVDAEPATSVDSDIASRNRINSFLYAAVVPKLQSCWTRVQGKGEIVFRYTYRRSGTNWVWAQQEIESSTIDKTQEAVALQCMQEAVRDTSFPMEAAEAARKGDGFVLHWSWPVPFPSDVTTLGRMINPGGGSGECKASCVKCDCPFTPGKGVSCSCKSSCSGYTSPCTVHADAKGCNMQLPACATGRIGGGGGIVIARKE